MEDKFIDTFPSYQNIINIFEGEWSSKMPDSSGLLATPGHATLFQDERIAWMARELGPITGMSVLELGPLEGAHSYMLQQLGAFNVVSLEANVRAFLKCLCVKEIYGLCRVNYLLGNFIPYLKHKDLNFDLIIASGVLYHMVEPWALLELMVERSNKIFLWSHYFDKEVIDRRSDHELFSAIDAVDFSGHKFLFSKRVYPNAALNWNGFSGGNDSYATWMSKESILTFLEAKGFIVKTDFDQPHHPNGPAFAICAHRSGKSTESIPIFGV